MNNEASFHSGSVIFWAFSLHITEETKVGVLSHCCLADVYKYNTLYFIILEDEVCEEMLFGGLVHQLLYVYLWV